MERCSACSLRVIADRTSALRYGIAAGKYVASEVGAIQDVPRKTTATAQEGLGRWPAKNKGSSGKF